MANSKPVDFPAGTKWHYSNTGYFRLGHIVQKVDGKPYDEVLHKRILDPLGMIHTRQSDPSEVIPNRCSGYQRTDKGLGNRDAMEPTACLAAGTIVSTIEDMAKWDSAINHHRFLKPETQKLMWEKTELLGGEKNYGFGWFMDEWRGHPCVDHAGGTPGFTCDYRRFQDLGLSVVVWCNLYDIGVENIAIRSVDSVRPGLSYVSVKPMKDAPKIHDMLLKAMADVAKGGARSPSITESMWKSYSEASRRACKDWLVHLKSFRLLEHTRYAPVDSGLGDQAVETYVYRMKTGDQTLFLLFKLTADGRIALHQQVEN